MQTDTEYAAVGRLLVPYAEGKSYLCTATLVREDVALTAKHCFTAHGYNATNGPITLRFGSRMATEGGQVREATQLTLGNGFDLALVRFSPVGGIRPMPLVSKATESKLYKNGTVGLAVGWGGTSSGQVATQLQEGSLKIKDQAYSTAQKLTGYNYLMKAESFVGDTAGGDSGGPLINQDVLVGVLSQRSKGGASAYTKVGSTRPWITENLDRMR